jgi:hypothetical protein
VRTLVIGDIHGCYDELRELLDRAALTADDRVVAVGDLVVKGEKNREVLDLFMSDPRFSSVQGNHDRALALRWLAEQRGEKLKVKGSQKRCYKELKKADPKYLDYLTTLPATIDLGDDLIVHAGLRPGVPLAEQAVEDLTELRTLGKKSPASKKGTPWYKLYEGDRRVLFGHWPSPFPRQGPKALGLDTGCVYGFHLTGYIVESDELIRVCARRAYDADDAE